MPHSLRSAVRLALVAFIAGVLLGVLMPRLLASNQAAPPQPQVHVVAPCIVGEDAGSFRVLEDVEIDPGGNVWVAGECGVLQRSTNGTSWAPIRTSPTKPARRR